MDLRTFLSILLNWFALEQSVSKTKQLRSVLFLTQQLQKNKIEFIKHLNTMWGESKEGKGAEKRFFLAGEEQDLTGLLPIILTRICYSL